MTEHPPPPDTAPAPTGTLAPAAPRRKNFAWIGVLLALVLLAGTAVAILTAVAPARESPIHLAAKTGDTATLATLLSADPSLANARTEGMGATPLHWAAGAGKLEAVKILLKYGADPSLVHKIGGTALHSTIHFDRPIVAEYLLDHGCDINARDAGGRTAVFLAVLKNRPVILKMLLDRHADISIPDHDWVTPLQEARICQNKEILDMLLAAGATQ